MKIDTSKYVPFTEAVELSKRSGSTFYEHVLRGNIAYIDLFGHRLYSKKDVISLSKKKKQPNKSAH